MLDTQIYDKIITIQGMIQDLNSLTAQKKIDLVTTHVQIDELTKIPDIQKREQVMQVPFRQIVTSGGIFNVSKFGQSSFGDGAFDGHNLNDIVIGNYKHNEDALITLTALKETDVFVTEDSSLYNRVAKSLTPLQVWDFQKFSDYIQQLKADIT